MLKGIDVSQHQGSINWDAVKPQIDFAMLRAGYGSSTIDQQFIRNIQECNRLNIPVGIYWFSYALNTDQARHEAEKCIETIKAYNITFPVVYDLEYDSIRYAKDNGIIIDKTRAVDMTIAFLDVIEQAGYKPMLYANLDYLNNMFDVRITKYDLWYARYGISNLDRQCSIWQYSESGQLNGISGNSVDLNYCYKDYSQIKKEVKYDMKNLVVYQNSIDKRAAEYLSDALLCPVIDGMNDYDYSNIENVFCVGAAGARPFTSYCTKLIAGTDRFDTCQKVLDFIKNGCK